MVSTGIFTNGYEFKLKFWLCYFKIYDPKTNKQKRFNLSEIQFCYLKWMLNAGYYSIKFIDEVDCVKFYQYNKNLLFKERQRKIISDIDEINEMMASLKHQ